MCTTPTEKMAEVNKALEENKNKVLERYKSCMNLSNNSKTEMVSIPLFYDASRRISYPMFNSLDECSERAKDIKKVVERFKNNPAILQALTLDFAPQYNETCQRISQEYQLKVTETNKIADLINELRNKYLLIANDDERVELVLNQLRENIINKIRDEELVDEMYEKLLDNVLNAARNNKGHILHQNIINTSIEDVKDKIKENSNVNSDRIRLLNSFLEYAAEKTKPDLNIINVLLINGASLLNSYCGMDPDGRSQSTSQYFLRSSNLDLTSFPDKSIFTIMKEAHKVLFDFPIMKGGINLTEVLSAVPSKFAEFKGDEKDKPILTKVGEKGEKKLMELLNDYKKLVEEKESGRDTRNIAKKLWSKLLNIFNKSATNPVKKDYTSIYKKLDECIEVGYLAVATGDDKVIIDYARVVKKEQENERDEDVKKLCDIFLTILYEHQDLVKLSWKEVIPYKFKRCVKRNPAWEKILTSPKLKDIKYNIPELNDIIPDLKDKNYDTRAGEWSGNNHTIIQGRIEKKRLAQSEALKIADQTIDEEKTRADQAEEENIKLKEMLKRAGIDPASDLNDIDVQPETSHALGMNRR